MAACLAPLLAACGPSVLADRDWSPRQIPSDCEVRVEYRDSRGTSTTVRHHDARGRLVSGTARPTYDGRGWERVAYDARGRPVAIISHEERGEREGNCDVEGGCDEPALRALDRIDLAWDEGGRLRRRAHRRDAYVEHEGKYVRKHTTTEERAYGYDGAGRLVRMESDDVRHTLEYDDAGRPVREIAEASDGPVHRRPITYDDAGRTARYGSPGHTSLYRYDEHGRVVRRDGEGSPDFNSYEAWEYDARGAVVRHLQGLVYTRTGRQTEHERVFLYDDRGRLRAIHDDGSPGWIYTYAGACDAVKNAPRPPSLLGPVRCVESPHGLLQTCW